MMMEIVGMVEDTEVVIVQALVGAVEDLAAIQVAGDLAEAASVLGEAALEAVELA